MRTLVAHVRYRQEGGEDRVFDSETGALREDGVEVGVLELRSDDLRNLGLAQKVGIALGRGDHRYGRDAVRSALDSFHPDVVHFHNLYPLLGVGAVVEASVSGAATVVTLHNYRLSCLAGTHVYKGCVCERCSPGRFHAGVARRCYRDSLLLSCVMALALGRQWRWMLGGVPDLTLCLTPYMLEKLAAYGAPVDRLVVKANGTLAPGGGSAERSGALYVGRLVAEKGILDLVRAWPAEGPRLAVVGDGPLRSLVEGESARSVQVLGALPPSQVASLIESSNVLVVPSVWYEGLPLVMLEAMASSTPVVAFDMPNIGRLVREVSAELIVPVGEFHALAEKATELASEYRVDLGERCAEVYAGRYSMEESVGRLREAYSRAIGIRNQRAERG